MSPKRFNLFTIPILIAALISLWLPSPVSADESVQLFPVDDGTIIDQSPFDGVGDAVDHDQYIFANLNAGIAGFRGAMEFDVSSISPNRTIASAYLNVVPAGKGYLPGTLSIPIDLFGYSGNGTVGVDDFIAGSHIATFDGLAAPVHVPVTLDVTEFLKSQMPTDYIGFTLRSNVHGAGMTFDSLEFGSPPILVITLAKTEVSIDIKPGSDTNPINSKSKGKIPVAILSTADFDAPLMVDATSLTFGKTGDEASVAFCGSEGEDVNEDGLPDLVCHFFTQSTSLQFGNTMGILKGQTVDGVPIEGSDTINIVNASDEEFIVCPFEPIMITLTSPDPVKIPVQITSPGQDLNFGATDPPGVNWALTNLDGTIIINGGIDDGAHFSSYWSSVPGYYYVVFDHPEAGTTYPTIQINLACDYDAPQP